MSGLGNVNEYSSIVSVEARLRVLVQGRKVCYLSPRFGLRSCLEMGQKRGNLSTEFDHIQSSIA